MPSIAEILIAPLMAAVVIEMAHTRTNELELFFLPFLVCTLRFIPTQYRRRSVERRIGPAPRLFGPTAVAAAFDNASLMPLLLMEVGAVVAGSPGTPRLGWAWVGGFYAGYVALRLFGREKWRQAIASITS